MRTLPNPMIRRYSKLLVILPAAVLRVGPALADNTGRNRISRLGYSVVDSPDFLKASDDVREGRDRRECHWYLWSDREDAPPPGAGDHYFFIRPKLPGYDAARNEFWQ